MDNNLYVANCLTGHQCTNKYQMSDALHNTSLVSLLFQCKLVSG